MKPGCYEPRTTRMTRTTFLPGLPTPARAVNRAIWKSHPYRPSSVVRQSRQGAPVFPAGRRARPWANGIDAAEPVYGDASIPLVERRAMVLVRHLWRTGLTEFSDTGGAVDFRRVQQVASEEDQSACGPVLDATLIGGEANSDVASVDAGIGAAFASGEVIA